MNAEVMMRQALREAARRYPDSTAEELADAAADILVDWRADAAEERGEIEDTPCLENCDRWGTGEGRFHGVIA